MKNIGMLFFMIILFLTGCDEVKKSGNTNIFGGLAVQNATDKELDRVSVSMDGRAIGFGVLTSGSTKSMGFGQFEVGKELKINWLEDLSSNKPIKGEAFFDSKKLSDIAEKIKEIEFVYIGNKKWKLRAYKALHRYDKDLLREIDSLL